MPAIFWGLNSRCWGRAYVAVKIASIPLPGCGTRNLYCYMGVRAGLWPTGFVNMVVYWRILYAYAISNINLGGNSPICIFPEFG